MKETQIIFVGKEEGEGERGIESLETGVGGKGGTHHCSGLKPPERANGEKKNIFLHPSKFSVGNTITRQINKRKTNRILLTCIPHVYIRRYPGKEK